MRRGNLSGDYGKAYTLNKNLFQSSEKMEELAMDKWPVKRV